MKSSYPILKFETYLLVLVFVFMFTGIGLFFYCHIENINVFARAMSMQSNPLFYLVMGFICFCLFVSQRLDRDCLWFKVFCIMVFVMVVFCVYVFMFDYMGYI